MRLALAAVFLALGTFGTAVAQGLIDPTRPPQTTPDKGEPEQRPSGPQLQSVLISPGRRVAVISGSAIALGGRYGDATVASISEDAVVLQYRDRRQTLFLVPDVEKRVREANGKKSEGEGDTR